MTSTMERPREFDFSLAQKADRKLRRFGSGLNNFLLMIVETRGVPDFVSTEEVPKPLDANDRKIARAIGNAEVMANDDGTFRAICHDNDDLINDFFMDGKTSEEALSELREELRYLICKPVKMRYTAYSKNFVADVRPAREGGFWAKVPSLGGASTCGNTMDEMKYMLIDMTKLMIEET